MKKLVVNADDFGRSSLVNQGIIEAHQKGIVTSASLMTDRDGFEEAVRLARENPRLGIGLHLDLDSFFDIEHGAGRLRAYKDPAVTLGVVAEETERQIRKALATGLPMGHLDGHHHAHLRPELFAAIAALAAKHRFKVIRYFRGYYEGLYPGAAAGWVQELPARFGLACVDTFFAGWEPVESSIPGYRYLDLSVPFKKAELMVHPGKGEAWRERELALCIAPDFPQALKEHQVELATFGQL